MYLNINFLFIGKRFMPVYDNLINEGWYLGEIRLILSPAWISNHTHYNVWDEIIYPFLNFNGATVEV